MVRPPIYLFFFFKPGIAVTKITVQAAIKVEEIPILLQYFNARLLSSSVFKHIQQTAIAIKVKSEGIKRSVKRIS